MTFFLNIQVTKTAKPRNDIFLRYLRLGQLFFCNLCFQLRSLLLQFRHARLRCIIKNARFYCLQ